MLTVVLVHGGLPGAAVWVAVAAQLMSAGLDVLVAAPPLTGLGADAAAVAGTARTARGPVLLVGHGYGGAVVTAAATEAGPAGLIYTAAYAPAPGECVADLAVRFPATLAYRRPLDVVAFAALVAGDLDPDRSAALAATQLPLAEACRTEPMRGRLPVPSWYLVAADDRCLPADAQRFLARRAGSHLSETAGSHAVPVSQPTAVADVVLTAAHVVG